MDEIDLRNLLAEMHVASYGWAVLCCRGDRELAEDVLQSVYVMILSKPESFARKSSFRTWLFGVIRNNARSRSRKRWWERMVRLDSEFLMRLIQKRKNDELHQDDLIAIRSTLTKLPSRQQEVAHLVFYEGLKLAEAAEVLGIEVGTARQHYHRAKAKLREALSRFDLTRTEKQ